MASTPQRPAPPPSRQPEHHQPPHKEPERHPAQPPEAKPGVPQPDQQPHPDDPNAKPPPEEKVLDKEDAKQLLHAGHRLKKKGDPPEKWVSMSRIANHLVLCRPLDEETENEILEEELVLVSD